MIQEIAAVKNKYLRYNFLVILLAVLCAHFIPVQAFWLRIVLVAFLLAGAGVGIFVIYSWFMALPLESVQQLTHTVAVLEERERAKKIQLTKIISAIGEAARKNKTYQIEGSYDDDLKPLCAALNQTLNSFHVFLLCEEEIKKDLHETVNKILVVVQAVEHGDLTQKIVSDRDDEIGQIFAALNNLTETLRKMVVEIRNVTVKLTAASSELAKISHQSTVTISQVANTITQISTSMAQISQNTQSADMAAQQTLSVARQGNEQIQKAIESIKTTKVTVDTSARIIRELGRQSSQIGEIITVITKIADQTNLLSLNAAIEAARAGELGRGFAVVADEVRKLAEGSAQSAGEISRLISEVQNETAKAVNAVEQGAQKVEDGVQVTLNAAKSFEEIADSSRQMAEQIQNISAATEETAAGAEQASASSQEQVGAVEEITAAIAGLNDVAKHLEGIVGKFKA